MLSSFFIRIGAPVALCVAAMAAHAQAARPAKPDPLDAAASAPRARHESTFKTYRRQGEIEPTPWPQANQTVESRGGWRAYAREAQAAPAPAASPPAPTTVPAKPATGHGAHQD